MARIGGLLFVALLYVALCPQSRVVAQTIGEREVADFRATDSRWGVDSIYRLSRVPNIKAYDTYLEQATSYLFSFLRYQPRGIPSSWQGFVLDGIVMNSLSDGRVPFAALGAIYNVATFEQESSSLFFDHDTPLMPIGGGQSINIDAQSESSGGYATTAISNRTYTYRLAAGYRLNRMESDGWAAMVDVSRRFGRSMTTEGIFADNYDIALSGTLSLGHNAGELSLTAMVNPTERGLPKASTLEAYDLAQNNLYNPAWGVYDGEQRSVNVSRTIEPILLLRHEISIGDSMVLSSGLAGRFGSSRRSYLNWQNSPNPRPDYYAYMPSFQDSQSAAEAIAESWRSDVDARQINFSELYEINSGDDRASYIVEDRVVEPIFVALSSTLTANDFSVGVSLTGQSEHRYKEINSLLGADHWLDIDSFVEQEEDIKDMTQNDVRNPNREVVVGDEFGYNYRMDNVSLRVDGTYFRTFDGGLTLSGSAYLEGVSSMRTGYYEKENFWGSESYGRSDVVVRVNSALSLQGVWAMSTPLTLGVAAYIGSISPNSNTLFINPQYRNALIADLENSLWSGIQCSATLNLSRLKGQVNLYYLSQSGGSVLRNLYDDMQSAYTHYVLRSIDTYRAGIELSVEYELCDRLHISGALVASSNKYRNNPTGSSYMESNGVVLIDSEEVEYGGYHIGGIPETIGSVSLSYEPFGWFARLSAVYYSGGYETLSPMRYTTRALGYLPYESTDFRAQAQLPSGVSLDLFGGYTHYFDSGESLGCYVTLSNLLNDSNIARYSYQSDRFYTDEGYNNLSPQPSLYYFALPFNFSVNITFRF